LPAHHGIVVSKAMPFAITGLLVGWMALYGRRAKRRGELAAQVALDARAHPDSVLNAKSDSQPPAPLALARAGGRAAGELSGLR
jgi:hypothetical protein